MNRTELIKQAAGPLPPFIKELRSAIRAGEKTQTRRLMKKQPLRNWIVDTLANGFAFYRRRGDGAWEDDGKFMCPYGKAGQIRYLREPIYKGPGGFAHYVDDDAMVWDGLTGQRVAWRWKPKTLSQIYMPSTFARTFVTLNGIRAERLQSISEADCKAEGVGVGLSAVHGETYKTGFQILWDSINAKRGYAWAGNWWVWVLVFELIGGNDGN